MKNISYDVFKKREKINQISHISFLNISNKFFGSLKTNFKCSKILYNLFKAPKRKGAGSVIRI